MTIPARSGAAPQNLRPWPCPKKPCAANPTTDERVAEADGPILNRTNNDIVPGGPSPASAGLSCGVAIRLSTVLGKTLSNKQRQISSSPTTAVVITHPRPTGDIRNTERAVRYN